MGEGAGQQRLGSLLVELGFIEEAQLESALEEQQRTGQRLGKILVDAAVLTESRLVHALSRQLGIDSCEPLMTSIHPQVLGRIPIELAYQHLVIPIAIKQDELGECLYVATSDPLDTNMGKSIRALSPRLRLRWLLASETELELALRRHYGTLPPSPSAKVQVIQGVPVSAPSTPAMPVAPAAPTPGPALIELKDDSMLGLDGLLVGRSAQAISSAIEAAMPPGPVESAPAPKAGRVEMNIPGPEAATEIAPLLHSAPESYESLPELEALSALGENAPEEQLSWGDLVAGEEPTKVADERVIRDLAAASREALQNGERSEFEDEDSLDLDIDVQTMSVEGELEEAQDTQDTQEAQEQPAPPEPDDIEMIEVVEELDEELDEEPKEPVNGTPRTEPVNDKASLSAPEEPAAKVAEAPAIEEPTPDVKQPPSSTSRSDFAQPNLAQPELAQRDLAERDLAGSDMSQAKSADPDLADPDLAEPDLAEPELVERDEELEESEELEEPAPLERALKSNGLPAWIDEPSTEAGDRIAPIKPEEPSSWPAERSTEPGARVLEAKEPAGRAPSNGRLLPASANINEEDEVEEVLRSLEAEIHGASEPVGSMSAFVEEVDRAIFAVAEASTSIEDGEISDAPLPETLQSLGLVDGVSEEELDLLQQEVSRSSLDFDSDELDVAPDEAGTLAGDDDEDNELEPPELTDRNEAPDISSISVAALRSTLERVIDAEGSPEDAQLLIRVLAAVLMDEGLLNDERLERALQRLRLV